MLWFRARNRKLCGSALRQFGAVVERFSVEYSGEFLTAPFKIRAQQSLDIISVASFALPDYFDAPPQIGQCGPHATITLQGPAKFILPEGRSSLRNSRAPAPLMAMPKTAVNKQGDSP